MLSTPLDMEIVIRHPNGLLKRIKIFRWRFIGFRYLSGLLDQVLCRIQGPSRLYILKQSYELASEGVVDLTPDLPSAELPVLVAEMRHLLESRRGSTGLLEEGSRAKPFVNLLDLDNELGKSLEDSHLIKIALNRHIIRLALDYLGVRCSLDSIQMLYSFHEYEHLLESQYWHKDYGAKRSIHVFIPVTDMSTDSPFYVLPPKVSASIPSRPWIRRISPTKMSSMVAAADVKHLLLPPNNAIALDPAISYHRYGSPRDHGAIFITFNTFPLYYRQDDSVRLTRHRLYPLLKSINPELSDSILKSLLRIGPHQQLQ